MDFVLTSDLDWASEFAIENFVTLAARFSIRPTLFVTHRSDVAEKAANEGRVELALHPNFLSNSTHGASIDEVADHILSLAPDATAWRCHRFVDSEAIRAAMAARGLRVESNSCLHLHPTITHSHLPGGTIGLPVFFEDDVHWGRGLSWRFADHSGAFESPGLKILNFHPFFVALNIADAGFYADVRQNIRTLTRAQAAELRNEDQGAGTFLLEAIESILAMGHRFVTLSEFAESVRSQREGGGAPSATRKSGGSSLPPKAAP